MADATSLMPPSPGLSATIFPHKCVESKGPENVKITTLYRCTGRFLGPPHDTTTDVVSSK